MKAHMGRPLYWTAILLLWFSAGEPALASPPVVVSVKPAPGATNVPLHAAELVEIRFDQEMNKGSVESAVSMSPNNVPFAWRMHSSFRWKDDRTLAFIRPGDNNVVHSLTSGTLFTVTLRAGARSKSGEPLLQPFQWSFRTGDRIVLNDQVEQLFSSAYSQLFALNVPSPAYVENVPLAHPDNLGETLHYWISTAYLGSRVYRIDLLDDGTLLKSDGFARRPQGTYRVALVATDYGNTDIARLMDNLLVEGQEDINRKHEAFAKSQGYGRPIVRFINTNFLASASEVTDPTSRDQIITLLERRGYSKDDFDIFLSLDISHHAGGSAGGDHDFIYMGNYFSTANLADPWRGKTVLYWILSAAYNHECGHLFGWEHEWIASSEGGDFITDPILYGWTDTDGDRIPEIWDPTPYGVTDAPSLPSFLLVPAVGSQSVSPGASAAFRIKVRPMAGFIEPVDLSAYEYPPDPSVGVSLSSTHVTPGGNVALTVSTSAGTRPSTFDIVLLGQSGSVKRVESVRLKVAGLVINSASFDGKKALRIEGAGFGASPRVLINGADRSGRISSKSDTFLELKGNAKQLGLKAGDNRVQVVDASGARSNVFVVRL
jgi:hypothetical protein